MRNSAITAKLDELRSLIERTNEATDDINLQNHWGRYLCIMAAGFLEFSLQSIYTDFAKGASSPHVAKFASQQLKRITNPNTETFLQTAGAFNDQWREGLIRFFSDDPTDPKDAIDSIINNRNQIAHGGTVGISVHRVRDYLDRSVPVLEFIENQCGGLA